MLVELNICFAASNPQPRLNVLPRRDFPAHAPPFLPSFCPYQGHVASYKLSPYRTEKAQCFVARYSRGAIVIKRGAGVVA